MAFGNLINFARRTYETGMPPRLNATNLNEDQRALNAVCSWADLFHAAPGGTPGSADSIWYWSQADSTIKVLTWSQIEELSTSAYNAAVLAAAGDATSKANAARSGAEGTAASALSSHVAVADPHGVWGKLGTWIAGGTAKATPVDADKFSYSNSESANATVVATWAQLIAAIRTKLSDASATVKGLMRTATLAELEAGIEGNAAIPPSILRSWAVKRTPTPDNAPVYASVFTSDVEGFTATNATLSVAITPGSLRATATSTGFSIKKEGLANAAGKVVAFRIISSVDDLTGYSFYSRAGGNTLGAPTVIPVYKSKKSYYSFILPFAADGFIIAKNSGASVGEWMEVSVVSIGDLSYLSGSAGLEGLVLLNQLENIVGVGSVSTCSLGIDGAGNASAGDWFDVGGWRYTFRATVAELVANGDVLLGLTASESRQYIYSAIYRNSPAIYDKSSGGSAPVYYATASFNLEKFLDPSSGFVGNVYYIYLKDKYRRKIGNTIPVSKSGTYLTVSPFSGGLSDVDAKIITAVQNNIAGDGTRPAAAKIELTDTTKIGYEDEVDKAVGATLTLPAGGTWIWFVHGYGATVSSAKKGSSAGGATLTMAGANGSIWYRKYS